MLQNIQIDKPVDDKTCFMKDVSISKNTTYFNTYLNSDYTFNECLKHLIRWHGKFFF